MRTLKELYREISSVADYSEITVTDPNTPGLFGNRPLHIAAVWGDCEAIEILIKAGAEINQKGEHGFTPLLETVAQGNLEAVKVLVKHGAQAIKNDEDQSPSEYAQISKNEAMVKYLQENGL